MWSVWSEPVEIYLGQGISLLKTRHQAVRALQHPATLPLAQVLARLAQALTEDSAGHRPKRRLSLKISLSATLCPAITVTAPPDVTHWSELKAIANACAAKVLGIGVNQVLCELDAARSGVAAAIPTPLMAELQHWATTQNYRICSVRPLWAMATHSQVAQQAQVQGVLIQEPDSVTVVAEDSQGKRIAATLVSRNEGATAPAPIRRWLVGLGLSEDKLLKLTFSTQAQGGLVQGKASSPWALHWSSP